MPVGVKGDGHTDAYAAPLREVICRGYVFLHIAVRFYKIHGNGVGYPVLVVLCFMGNVVGIHQQKEKDKKGEKDKDVEGFSVFLLSGQPPFLFLHTDSLLTIFYFIFYFSIYVKYRKEFIIFLKGINVCYLRKH